MIKVGILEYKDPALILSGGSFFCGLSNNAEVLSGSSTPIWEDGYPFVTNVSPTSAGLYFKTNASSMTGYAVVLPNGVSSPSATQIENGLDANNNPVPSGFHVQVPLITSEQVYFGTATNLSIATDYDAYFVIDGGGNNYSTVEKIDFNSAGGVTTTTTRPPITGTAYVDLSRSEHGTGYSDDPFNYEDMWAHLDPNVINHYYIKGQVWDTSQWFYQPNNMDNVTFEAWDPAVNGPFSIRLNYMGSTSIHGTWIGGMFSYGGTGELTVSVNSGHVLVLKSMIFSLDKNFIVRGSIHAFGTTFRCQGFLDLYNPCVFNTVDSLVHFAGTRKF
jgi:hypothetical protein